MKKLLSVAVALMTAALFFAGCSNSVSETLPGTWVSSVQYYSDGTSGNWTNSRNRISYSCADPSTLGIEANTSNTYFCYPTPTQIYGVRAKVKQNSFTDTDQGIILFLTSNNDTGNWDSYYRLSFWKNSFILFEKLNGSEITCLSQDENGYVNTFSNAINSEGQENEVLFYTDGNNLVIKVNGTELKRIPKRLDSGKAGACIVISDDSTGPINANWEFVEFQTAK